MTVKYRVKTKHTKELLKEFVKFSFRVNHPKTTLRLFVIGVGFLIIGTGIERGSLAMWMCLVIGILLCIFAFARHHIGVMQLKGNDEIYQNDWEVDTSFLDGEIRIKNSGETKGFSKSYKEVAALYMDENNYKEADRVLTEMEAIVGTTDPDIAAARTSLDLERILGE